MSQTLPSPPKSLPRKPRAPRRPRRAVASSDDELDRIRSSDSETEESDSDTCSSSEALDTPAPPATATDHSASPPSTRRAKKRSPAKADPSVIPPQSNWDDLVGHDEALDSSGPPIIDFADFVSGALDAAGPSHTEPDQEGGEPVPVSGRGKSRPRGKTQRQAYLERLSEDPSYTPRVGAFWGHDERLLAPELRGMSDWWRGRWSGRGRGRGRANRIPSERPSDQDTPEAAPIERTWAHDGFERLNERDYRPTRGKGRARARGRGGSAREPEQLWTKAPDTHLHIDPSTRPEFPGQGRGITVNLPGQWRPSMVRVSRNPRPAPAQPTPKAPIDVPTEIVVKLPGKDAKVVSVSHPAPAPPVRSTLPEDPETVQPLQDVPPKVVARIPRGSADTASTKSPAASSPVQAVAPKPDTLSRPAPTSAFPVQVLNQTPASVPPKPAPPVHGRTRSQLGAVAFARPPAVPLTDTAVPLAFGSFEPPVAPVPAPPPVTSNTSPSINPPAAVPPPIKDAPPAPPPLNIPSPVSIRPPPPPMASYTPPPTNPYYNPYAYNPLDGATYYSTATPPPPHHPGMYYPANGFFVPPRPSGPVAIRAPGESANPNGVVNGEDSAARPPVPPMWNYYHPHPISHHSHSHSHSHSHGHNSYYSPSATPYPPPPPGPHQPGYYPGVGEYGNVYDYSGGGVYY